MEDTQACGGSTRHRSKVEAPRMSLEGWMDKHNGVHSHSGILFCLKKEGNSDHATTQRNLEDIMLSQSQKDKQDLSSYE